MSRMNWAGNKANARAAASRRDDNVAALARAARDASRPPRPKRPTLAEPVVIARFDKNLSGDIVDVRLEDYQGRPFVDLRTWYTAPNGVLKRSDKGLFLSVWRLPDLAAAVNAALAKARSLGLIPDAADE